MELLFDRFRLAALDGHRSDAGDEVSSVISEVTRLLNVRAPLAAAEATAGHRRTVVDYGMVDFLHLSPLGRKDAQQLAAYVYDAVEAYEPRLILDKVVVEAPRPARDALCAILTGRVRRRQHPDVRVNFSVRVASAIPSQWSAP